MKKQVIKLMMKSKMKKRLNLMKVIKKSFQVKDMIIKILQLMKGKWKKDLKKCIQLSITLKR